MTLVEFLRARLDEDEATAHAAADAPWLVLEGVDSSQVLTDPAAIREQKWRFGRLGHVASTLHVGYAEHIARHDPARVLAEVETKRKIVGWHTEPHYCTDQGNLESWYTPEHPCPTLRAMTLPHANHQDYRQEWAP